MKIKLFWWGWNCWDFWKVRPTGIMFKTYKWMLRLGPLNCNVNRAIIVKWSQKYFSIGIYC